LKAKRVKRLDPETPLVENAARIVEVRLGEVRSLAPAALEAPAAAEQHDLRIAAKRLRYVLETTEFCFGRPAETARRRARDLQEVLGDLHDCDLMLPRATEHVDRLRSRDAEVVHTRAEGAADLDPAVAARAPHRTAYRGLEVLAVHVQARRALLYERFVELWSKLERDGTWTSLERAVRRKRDESRERRAARERAERAARDLESAKAEEREAGARARRAADVMAEARRVPGASGPDA
jgi:hypothetical protein